MLGFLISVVGVLVVAALLFLGASLLMGRGETQPPAELDRSPVELPDDRPVTGDDVRDLRISVAARGYRMTEVDWLLEQFADALDERDAEIASLRARLSEQQEAAADAAPQDQPDVDVDVMPSTRSDRVPELTVSVDVEAPPLQVWRALVDWERQGEWMPLTDVRVVAGDRHGVGGRIEARTGMPIGGGRHVGVLDTLEITGWHPPYRVEVLHTGRVLRGPGIFEVRPRMAGATVVWTELLDLPLGALGRAGWPLMRPAAAFVWHLALNRFRDFARRYPD